MEEVIAGWQRELERAHQRIADLFARSEVRERSLSCLEGLLSGCERKNSWQVAEWAGEASPLWNAVHYWIASCIFPRIGSRQD